MKIRVIAVNMDEDERALDTVITDSPNRAMQMYGDELREDERVDFNFCEEEEK